MNKFGRVTRKEGHISGDHTSQGAGPHCQPNFGGSPNYAHMIRCINVRIMFLAGHARSLIPWCRASILKHTVCETAT